MFDKDGIPGAKTVFYSNENNICGSVEEFALEHFRSASQMPEGLHAEGSVVNTICAVLFWEVRRRSKTASGEFIRLSSHIVFMEHGMVQSKA